MKKISLLLNIIAFCASAFASFHLINEISFIETQIKSVQSLESEVKQAEEERKNKNKEHASRYSIERAKNQALEEEKFESEKELATQKLVMERAHSEITEIEEYNNALLKSIEEAKLELLRTKKTIQDTIDESKLVSIEIPQLRQRKDDIVFAIKQTSLEADQISLDLEAYSEETAYLKEHYENVVKALFRDKSSRNWLEKGEFIKITYMSIDLKNGVLGLPVGQEHGIAKNKVFAVYDRDEEICKLRITHAEMKKSVGAIIPLIGEPIKLLKLDEFDLYHL